MTLYTVHINEKISKPLPLADAMDWLGSHMYVSGTTKAQVLAGKGVLSPDGLMFAYGFTSALVRPVN